MIKELQASNCKSCSGQKTVEWEDFFKVFMCSQCGWINKEKGKGKKK